MWKFIDVIAINRQEIEKEREEGKISNKFKANSWCRCCQIIWKIVVDYSKFMLQGFMRLANFLEINQVNSQLIEDS